MYLTARSLMRRLCLLILAMTGSVTAAYAGDDSWTSIGPTGGRVLALAGDPSNANVVYVGTDVGVFRSTNGGDSWTINNEFPAVHTEALAIDPTNANIVYAATWNGIFKSTNGGAIWTKTGPSPGSVDVLSIDPSDTDTIYMGHFSAGIFKSDDGGLTWTKKNAGLTDLWVVDIALDPTDGKIVYAATHGGVYKSTNGGGSWYSVNTGLIDARMPSQSLVSSLAIDPSNHALIYAGTRAGLFRSTNGGGIWNLIGNDGLAVHAVSMERSKNGVIYAGTDSGVLISTDKGDSWTRSYGPFSHVFSIHVKSSGAFYVGTLNGVFKTVDRGRSWTSANAGVNNTGITAIAIDPSNRRIIYAGSDVQGVFKTVDGGVSWTLAYRIEMAVFGSVRRVRTLAIDPANSRIIYVGFEGAISKSTNGGATWNLAIDGVGDRRIWSLAINPTDTNIVYACSPSEIIKSTNGGANWASASKGMTGQYIASLQIDPSDTNTIYAAAEQGGVFKSINGGASWAEINAGIEPYDDPQGHNNIVQFSSHAIAIDPSHTSTVYAASVYAPGLAGVFKSTNSGADWARAGALPIRVSVIALAVDPYNPNTIYGGTNGGGVLRSLDGGQTWTEFNAGLTTRNVASIAIDPSRTSAIYAGTMSAGIFRWGSKTPDAPADRNSADGGDRAAGNSDKKFAPAETSNPENKSEGRTKIGQTGMTARAVVLRTGDIVLARHEGKYCAIQAVEQTFEQRRGAIRYNWWYQPDGSASFTNRNTLTGSTEARENFIEMDRYYAAHLHVGPFDLEWSPGASGLGYVYFRHPDREAIVYELVISKEKDIRRVDAKREFQRVE